MEGEAAHHLGRVLRAQTGQLYELSDGEQVWLGGSTVWSAIAAIRPG